MDEDSKGREAGLPYIEAARPGYPVLLDERHVVAERYGTRNVPAGVWIDEEGRIVRGPEVASAAQRTPEGERVPHKKYLNALRDWVATGAESVYVRQGRKGSSVAIQASEEGARAAAHFRLGVYLHGVGESERAIAHFKRAHALAPENWNYKRQAWNLGDVERDYGTTMQAEREKGIPLHAPLEWPEADR
ncbi:MAG TPA: hypothetical protein VFX49_21725 [Chloroflexota bacterium]|nr:hypothetical protein [Chloroflexota bacterium]